MNICNDPKKQTQTVIGNLYLPPNGGVCILTRSNKMVRLSDGRDDVTFTDISYWVDVTDQYCLQKVK